MSKFSNLIVEIADDDTEVFLSNHQMPLLYLRGEPRLAVKGIDISIGNSLLTTGFTYTDCGDVIVQRNGGCYSGISKGA